MSRGEVHRGGQQSVLMEMNVNRWGISLGRGWGVGMRVAVLAAVVTLLLNIRALFCGFSPTDDHLYVVNNELIRHLDGDLLRWAFAPPPFDFWQPLTWISLAVDHAVWGLNPFGYHLTNILLHALNTLLVTLIADRVMGHLPALARRLASVRSLYPLTLLLAGLLFGMHPLRVESVVWITERKDVLNGAFTLGALLCYLGYAASQSAGDGKCYTRWYPLSLVLFALSLLVKPVSVVLPVILLALDLYPLERWRRVGGGRLLLEKVPFLCLATVIALLTLYFGARNQILKPYDFFTPWQRLVVSGNGIFEYLRLLLVPVGISPLKLLPKPIPPAYTLKSIAVFLLLLCSLGAAGKRRWIPVIWTCFLLPLLPVLAIFQNGDQAFAARYTYLPSIAPAIAVAVMAGDAYARGRGGANRAISRMIPLLGVACLLFYGAMTIHLTRVWDDPETYWTRVLTIDPVAKAYFSRGEYYVEQGRYGEAVSDYTQAINVADGDFKRYLYNLYAFRGEALRFLGRNEEAVRDLTTAIGMSPHRLYYLSRGKALEALGKVREAEGDFRMAGAVAGKIGYWFLDPSAEEIVARLEKSPDDAEALAARGVAATRRRDYRGALADLGRAISLAPGRAEFYHDRSTVYLETGMTGQALEDCSAALRLNPRFVEASLRRAAILAEAGQYAAALSDLNAVVGIDRRSFEGYANRGLVLYRLGSVADAIKDFDRALALNPDSAATWYNRGLARAASGDAGQAMADYTQARQLGYAVTPAEFQRILSTINR